MAFLDGKISSFQEKIISYFQQLFILWARHSGYCHKETGARQEPILMTTMAIDHFRILKWTMWHGVARMVYHTERPEKEFR